MKVQMSVTAKLAIFVCVVYKDINITEEIAALIPLKSTTKASDLLEGFATSMRLGLNLTDLLGVKTDGAPAVVGRREGLVMLMQEKVIKVGSNSVMQDLCSPIYAKSLKAKSVITVVVQVVRFIRP
jgi:hypothetical protein